MKRQADPDFADGETAGAALLVDAEVDDAPAPVPPAGSGHLLLGISLVLIAFNLRPLFSSASALLPELRSGLGLSSAGASILTTLPVVCLGLFSPFAPRFARRFGSERTLFGVLLLLGLGTALRGLSSIPALYLGSALAGACIAIGNVLLPGLVKRDFPHRTALMTGCYTMALCAGAASAAGLTLPLEAAFGDSAAAALAVWAIPAFAVALVWTFQLRSARSRPSQMRMTVHGLWRDPLAWQVTFFMGLQSALAYCVFGWLVPILRERGLDGVSAGAMVSMSVMVQAAACLIAPQIAVRGRDQRVVNAALVALAVFALMGLLFGPVSTLWLFAVLQGIGQGGLIAVALTVIVLRSPDPHVAAHLSGMAQCIGYLLAAVGPFLVGLIHGWTGSFGWSALLFALIGIGAGLSGWMAGRPLHVSARSLPVGETAG